LVYVKLKKGKKKREIGLTRNPSSEGNIQAKMKSGQRGELGGLGRSYREFRD